MLASACATRPNLTAGWLFGISSRLSAEEIGFRNAYRSSQERRLAHLTELRGRHLATLISVTVWSVARRSGSSWVLEVKAAWRQTSLTVITDAKIRCQILGRGVARKLLSCSVLFTGATISPLTIRGHACQK